MVWQAQSLTLKNLAGALLAPASTKPMEQEIFHHLSWSKRRRGLINSRAFIGWLFGSAAVHAAALAAIPYVEFTGVTGVKESVQVHLRASGNWSDPGIATLGAVTELQTPDAQIPVLETVHVHSSVIEVLPVGLGREPVFSSLDAEFELDRQVIASLDFLSGLVEERTAVRAVTPVGASVLNPPPTDLEQREMVEPASVDFLETSTADSLGETPVPFPRPSNVTSDIDSGSIADAPSNSAGVNEATNWGADAALAAVSGADVAPVSVSGAASAMQDLDTLLHKEIAKHKHYPALARRRNREGTATISFSLRPDGAIDDVSVVSSSGFGLLDKAALFAVNEAAPFETAVEYLDQARSFKVSIVFSLQ